MAQRSTAPPSQARIKSSNGLKALAASLPKVTARTLGRRGFAEAGLVNEWPAIVGSDIARQCRPRSLTYPRQGRRHGGTLTLRVAPAFALEIQHMEPILLERINRYYGYRAVGQIKLRQSPLPALNKAVKAATVNLRPSEEAALKLRLADIKDPELRCALERLGRGFLARHQKPDP